MFLGNDGNDDSSTAHAIKYDGVVPSEDNVLNGTYSIQRNLVLVTKGEPTGNVACFLNWITSAEGQEILGKEFVKLDESKFTSFTAPSQDGKTTIACGGSTSINETMTKLAQAYMAKYPYMNITVSGGGSGVGEKSTDSGVFDIGMLSRDMGSAYEGNLVPVNIGRDGVAIIANISGVENLSAEQVAKIFSGEITNWSQVGGNDEEIIPFQRNEGAGSQALMKKLVMGDTALMDPPTEYVVGDMAGLMSAVKSYDHSANAIGYSVYYYAHDMEMARGLKILSIDGVKPTAETIRDGEYPHRNAYYCVVPADAAADSPNRILYDWLMTEEGQRLLNAEGYVSVMDFGD